MYQFLQYDSTIETRECFPKERRTAMKSVVIGVVLCALFALVGFFVPNVRLMPYLTVALSVTTGMLCIGGILRYMMNGNI